MLGSGVSGTATLVVAPDGPNCLPNNVIGFLPPIKYWITTPIRLENKM